MVSTTTQAQSLKRDTILQLTSSTHSCLDLGVISHFETREKELVWMCLGLNISISRILDCIRDRIAWICLRSALFTISQEKTGKCMPKGQNQSDIVGSMSF